TRTVMPRSMCASIQIFKFWAIRGMCLASAASSVHEYRECTFGRSDLAAKRCGSKTRGEGRGDLGRRRDLQWSDDLAGPARIELRAARRFAESDRRRRRHDSQ